MKMMPPDVLVTRTNYNTYPNHRYLYYLFSGQLTTPYKVSYHCIQSLYHHSFWICYILESVPCIGAISF